MALFRHYNGSSTCWRSGDRRLNDVELTPDEARPWRAFMIAQIVRMLCAGLIHGDLSEFNVLLGSAGPVIIDLPQAVNAAGNNDAFRMLERDVDNMREAFGRAAPELLATEYAHEIWKLYEAGQLQPESPLTGRFEHDRVEVDVVAVLDLIEDERLLAEERQRRKEEASPRVKNVAIRLRYSQRRSLALDDSPSDRIRAELRAQQRRREDHGVLQRLEG